VRGWTTAPNRLERVESPHPGGADEHLDRSRTVGSGARRTRPATAAGAGRSQPASQGSGSRGRTAGPRGAEGSCRKRTTSTAAASRPGLRTGPPVRGCR